MQKLDLPMLDGNNLMINEMFFKEIWEELEEFLETEKGMDNLNFVKRILFNLEIKSNNTIEGIFDDLEFIETVIKNAKSIEKDEKRKRIINLYNGYKYILKNKTIDEKHLKELYGILSKDILSELDLSRMGEYYRTAPVYIMRSRRLDEENDLGIPSDQIEKYMQKYFEFTNSKFNGTKTEQFIKSQIMHLYFVIIHPYFDVNGRTSRTLAMWKLLNVKSYPYIIFNRAINTENKIYDKIISNSKNTQDASLFVKYMMENVKKELEKEMIMRQIKANTAEKMTATDFQALHYILSMAGEVNILTFYNFYKEKNNRKSIESVYNEVIAPLLEKDIIVVEKECKKKIFDNQKNEVYKLNIKKYDRDNPKIKKLSLENK